MLLSFLDYFLVDLFLIVNSRLICLNLADLRSMDTKSKWFSSRTVEKRRNKQRYALSAYSLLQCMVDVLHE